MNTAQDFHLFEPLIIEGVLADGKAAEGDLVSDRGFAGLVEVRLSNDPNFLVLELKVELGKVLLVRNEDTELDGLIKNKNGRMK